MAPSATIDPFPGQPAGRGGMMGNRRRLLSAACMALCGAGSLPAIAQQFPTKPLSIVVGFSPGGAIDMMARIVAKQLSDNTGLPVTVSNRAGAGGNLAQHFVQSSTPDGSTILLGAIGSLTINPHLMSMPYDPLRDLEAITMGASFPNILVVHANLGVGSLQALIEAAKARPLEYASSGVGSASHITGEMFNQAAGIDMRHVPYKGGSQAMLDLIGGRIAAYYSTPASALPHIETGKIKPLAVTGLKRIELLPEVPTIAESGFPGFNAINWYAFIAPPNTPAAILDRWNAELHKVLGNPAVKAQLDRHGLYADPGTREELRILMAEESDKWRKLITERKITI